MIEARKRVKSQQCVLTQNRGKQMYKDAKPAPNAPGYLTYRPGTLETRDPFPGQIIHTFNLVAPNSNPYALKESGGEMSAWTSAGLQPSGGYYPYDPTLAAYG
ncbi:unnamed protein product [Euphydryas editha]|uniref:Uncharacterized protein n=1 Tax=Euphydryas editha TaxID=104508 RepID=A0AAU9UZL1_EUPED|nr:unnamed protein product [Euphydryas editha]